MADYVGSILPMVVLFGGAYILWKKGVFNQLSQGLSPSAAQSYACPDGSAPDANNQCANGAAAVQQDTSGPNLSIQGVAQELVRPLAFKLNPGLGPHGTVGPTSGPALTNPSPSRGFPRGKPTPLALLDPPDVATKTIPFVRPATMVRATAKPTLTPRLRSVVRAPPAGVGPKGTVGPVTKPATRPSPLVCKHFLCKGVPSVTGGPGCIPLNAPICTAKEGVGDVFGVSDYLPLGDSYDMEDPFATDYESQSAEVYHTNITGFK